LEKDWCGEIFVSLSSSKVLSLTFRDTELRGGDALRTNLHVRPEGSRTRPPASGSAKSELIPGGTGPFPGASLLR